MKTIIIVSIAVFLLILLILFILKMYYKNKENAKFFEDARKPSPAEVELQNLLAEKKLKRNDIINQYYDLISSTYSMLKKRIKDDYSFDELKDITIYKFKVERIGEDMSDYAIRMLQDDVRDYTKNGVRDECTKQLLLIKKQIEDIAIMFTMCPFKALKLYSDIFVNTLYVCEQVNQGIEEKFKQDGILSDVTGNIKRLINEYKPISMIFSGADYIDEEVCEIILKKYEGEIIEIKSIDYLFEQTYYIVFDDIGIFTRKYNIEMDKIAEITGIRHQY